MPTFRDNPYGAFNYIVSIGGAQGDGSLGTVIGGFSDVSGLGMEVSYSDYRNGCEKFNTTRKVPNTHKLDDVTLKRGIVGTWHRVSAKHLQAYCEEMSFRFRAEEIPGKRGLALLRPGKDR